MDNIPKEHIPNEDDLRRLAEGDETVVNELIEGLTGFIINEMDWFVKTHPYLEYLYDDIISESLLELVDTVNKLLGKEFNSSHLIGYIRKACLIKVVNATSTIRLPVNVPERSLRSPSIVNFLDDIRRNTRPVKEHDLQTSQDSVFGEVWFDDFIATLDEREKKIISMKIEGKSNREIGREVGLEHNHVSAKLNKLLKRYLGE